VCAIIELVCLAAIVLSCAKDFNPAFRIRGSIRRSAQRQNRITPRPPCSLRLILRRNPHEFFDRAARMSGTRKKLFDLAEVADGSHVPPLARLIDHPFVLKIFANVLGTLRLFSCRKVMRGLTQNSHI